MVFISQIHLEIKSLFDHNGQILQINFKKSSFLICFIIELHSNFSTLFALLKTDNT